mmetsp:Transcript_8094/g.22363  ORF Transcript_8094/g.22363 Transcript_8094/m.22363 type:complete len:256 (+) Transcript_8094:1186-1953(+)
MIETCPTLFWNGWIFSGLSCFLSLHGFSLKCEFRLSRYFLCMLLAQVRQTWAYIRPSFEFLELQSFQDLALGLSLLQMLHLTGLLLQFQNFSFRRAARRIKSVLALCLRASLLPMHWFSLSAAHCATSALGDSLDHSLHVLHDIFDHRLRNTFYWFRGPFSGWFHDGRDGLPDFYGCFWLLSLGGLPVQKLRLRLSSFLGTTLACNFVHILEATTWIWYLLCRSVNDCAGQLTGIRSFRESIWNLSGLRWSLYRE